MSNIDFGSAINLNAKTTTPLVANNMGSFDGDISTPQTNNNSDSTLMNDKNNFGIASNLSNKRTQVTNDNMDITDDNPNIEHVQGFWNGVTKGWHNLDNTLYAHADWLPDKFKPDDTRYQEADGWAAELGDFLGDPMNLVIALAPEVKMADLGLKGVEYAASKLGVGSVVDAGKKLVTDATDKLFDYMSPTVAKVAKASAVGARIGATYNMGSTLLDHYEQEAAGIDNELTAQKLLTNTAEGAGAGMVLGGTSSVAFGVLSKASPVQKFMDRFGKDIKTGSTYRTMDKAYNPEQPETPFTEENIETDQPVLQSNDVPNNEVLDKIKPSKDAYQKNKISYDRTVDWVRKGVNDENFHQMVVSKKNEIEARYGAMLGNSSKFIVEHLLNPVNNLAIRKAMAGETQGLNGLDIAAGQLANAIDEAQIKEAQEKYGMDINYVDAYIKQTHDPDKLRAMGEDAWVNLIKPKLLNDISDDSLRQVFRNITNQQITDRRYTPVGTTNSYKEQVFKFKSAVDKWDYEQAAGYSKTIGQHVLDNISNLSTAMARHAIAGPEADPDKVFEYLARYSGRSEAKVQELLDNFNPPRNSGQLPAVLAEPVRAAVNASRFFNAVTAPLYVMGHVTGDMLNLFAQTLAKTNLVDSAMAYTKELNLIKGAPSELRYLSRLPQKEKEAWIPLIQDWFKNGTMEALKGIGIIGNHDATKFFQSATLKLSGAHMLDTFIRRQSLKVGSYLAKRLYDKGLLLPKLDQEILSKSLNKDGFLIPNKLIDLADSIEDKGLKQQYMDTANQLQNFYSSVINDVNPIYSHRWTVLNKLDPATAAGARAMGWQLRLWTATYKAQLDKLMNGPGKIWAVPQMMGFTLAMAGSEVGSTRIISYLKGEHDGDNEVKTYGIPSKLIKEGFDKLTNTADSGDDHIENLKAEWSNALARQLLTGTALWQAPTFYGRGKKLYRAISYEFNDDPDSANENFKKAFPQAAVLLNLWGGD